MSGNVKVKVNVLREFCIDALHRLGVPEADARITTDVLISADQRGVSSHGVQRFGGYVNGIRQGFIKPVTTIRVLKETPNTLLISGSDGVGQVIGFRSMQMVIDKALKNNAAFAVVRDSNHYGIAGYYAMMAIEHGLIGISLTNAGPIVIPTFSRERILGTNPIAVALPTGKERPFVLDMATSVVPLGKVEVYNREKKKMPMTWVIDENGNITDDPGSILQNTRPTKYGGLLPLGGAIEEDGSHKGYGLALLVDLLCGVLSGSVFGPNIPGRTGSTHGKLSHFFGAIRIDAFIEPDVFKNSMDEYIHILKNCGKINGQERIYVHGEKEFEKSEQQEKEVLILKEVVEELKGIGTELGIKTSLC